MHDMITFGAGLLIGAASMGGWWFWLGHKSGVHMAVSHLTTTTKAVETAAASVIDKVKAAA